MQKQNNWNIAFIQLFQVLIYVTLVINIGKLN